jgi:hypothetical protein
MNQTTAYRVFIRLKEMLRSWRFGFVALRRGSFEVPSTLRLGKKRILLQHPHDHGAKEDFLACFVDDVYGLARMTSKPRTILDIGANVGFFSLAARGYFPEAVIHAYEPNPRVLAHLAGNAAAGMLFSACPKLWVLRLAGFPWWMTPIPTKPALRLLRQARRGPSNRCP